ncbi:prostasin-like [Ostrinia nubilalis]|uniref:prostasin-like n=1 Tax=Ostrinia nubilalis TaxID=29057 RepID=UPI003082633B
MRSVVILFMLLVATNCFTADDVETLRREKRQETGWNWGTDGDETPLDRNSESQKLSTEPTTPTTTTVEPNPCLNMYKPEVKDFNRPGRRLSEMKCYEHIYDIKVRAETKKSEDACVAYNIRHPGPIALGGQFAIGGKSAEPGEFPHMGAIGWKAAVGTWIFKCGGSLISDKFVLTAAHCTKASERDTSVADVVPKIVRLGSNNIADSYANDSVPVTAIIKRIIEHPNYKAPKKYYDIALMELQNQVQFDNYVQPACLWSGESSPLIGQKATLTGWGVVETVSRTTAPDLQAAVVDVFESELCDKLLKPSCNRHWCGMQDHQLCAGKLAGGVDACQGDSGGPLPQIIERPLQIKIPLPPTTTGRMYYIVGVTSFGIGCALPNLPGIYTRVSSFIDWVEDIVWK